MKVWTRMEKVDMHNWITWKFLRLVPHKTRKNHKNYFFQKIWCIKKRYTELNCFIRRTEELKSFRDNRTKKISRTDIPNSRRRLFWIQWKPSVLFLLIEIKNKFSKFGITRNWITPNLFKGFYDNLSYFLTHTLWLIL